MIENLPTRRGCALTPTEHRRSQIFPKPFNSKNQGERTRTSNLSVPNETRYTPKGLRALNTTRDFNTSVALSI